MERSFTWKDTKGDKQQAFLRIGGYHVNAKKEDKIKAFTFGLQWGIVAYTLMNWTDSNRKTHFFAINVSF